MEWNDKMTSFLKKNLNLIIGIFLLAQPFIDLLTGLSVHLLNINITIGIILRVLFLIFIMFIAIVIFNKKKLFLPYILIIIYLLFNLIGVFLYKENNYFQEFQGLIKVFYFPLLLVSLYSLKDYIKISKMTLFTTFFCYLILIFIPTIFNTGFKTYEITKAGTLGFFNSANEISGIISLLTPIMFYILLKKKNIILTILTLAIYFPVILMMGTKTPLLSLGITLFFILIFSWQKSFQKKDYKPLLISLFFIMLGLASLILILPKTNFYKNIETHLDYLEVDNITEIFSDERLIDHFIFSERLTFLKRKVALFKQTPLYQKLFGIGYYRNNKSMKMIEMDYFDIYFSHGIIGFLIFFAITLGTIYKILEKDCPATFNCYITSISFILIIFLSFFTGHIITAPSVSLLAIILILSLAPRTKKDLLFADVNMEIGGIEKSQVNLLKNINYQKYNVTLILEEKKGLLLKNIPSSVNIQEIKVSNTNNLLIRKTLNYWRKLLFEIFNYNNFDFSCCYTTYSYSSNKIAKIASSNNSLYVHSDYKYVYAQKEDFHQFFDSRKVADFKRIIFVSNESRSSFLAEYKELEPKTLVFNNFIDIQDIKEKSLQSIKEKKNKNETYFVFVGRLDDSSKKLLRAINLVKNISSLHLWIIGTGPDRKMYEEAAKNNSRITFFGQKENPYPYIKAADYLILTSDYEGFPVTYLEALALNTNIITTINTSDDEINMKDYAYIVSKDEKQMLKEVKEILKNPSPKKKINLETIQEKRIKKIENIFK